jgi:hypothetical protein
MAAAAVYPIIFVWPGRTTTTHGGSRSLSNCFCVANNRYESEVAEEGRHLFSVFFFLFGICPLK